MICDFGDVYPILISYSQKNWECFSCYLFINAFLIPIDEKMHILLFMCNFKLKTPFERDMSISRFIYPYLSHELLKQIIKKLRGLFVFQSFIFTKFCYGNIFCALIEQTTHCIHQAKFASEILPPFYIFELCVCSIKDLIYLKDKMAKHKRLAVIE